MNVKCVNEWPRGTRWKNLTNMTIDLATIGVLSVGITMGTKAETVGRYKIYLIK